jgi:hypothetical protein
MAAEEEDGQLTEQQSKRGGGGGDGWKGDGKSAGGLLTLASSVSARERKGGVRMNTHGEGDLVKATEASKLVSLVELLSSDFRGAVRLPIPQQNIKITTIGEGE